MKQIIEVMLKGVCAPAWYGLTVAVLFILTGESVFERLATRFKAPIEPNILQTTNMYQLKHIMIKICVWISTDLIINAPS